MLRGALAGFVVGAVVAALLFRFFADRRGAEGPEGTGAVSPAGAPAAVADPEAARLREALAASEATVEGLRREIAALKAAPPAGGSAAAPAADWGGIGRKLLAARKDQRRFWDSDDSATQDLMFEFLAMMRAEAARLGVGVDEIIAAPSGLAALAEAFLENADPPMDEAQRARVREVLEKLGAGWEEYAKNRGSLTRLEMQRELDRMSDDIDRDISAALPEEHVAAWDDLRDFWYTATPASYGGGVPSRSASSTAEVVSSWTDSWSGDLELDAVQKVALRPLVEEHVRELERLHAAFPAATTDHQRIGNEVRDLMIRTHRRIADTLQLTDQQARALREWTRVEDFHSWGR